MLNHVEKQQILLYCIVLYCKKMIITLQHSDIFSPNSIAVQADYVTAVEGRPIG